MRFVDRFEGAVNNTLTTVFMKAGNKWFEECFARYDEGEFHQRMANGFSFIEDFRRNHSGGRSPEGNPLDMKYLKFMYVARSLYKKLHISLNEEEILNNIEQMLFCRGWTLYQNEVDKIRQDLLELKAEIES